MKKVLSSLLILTMLVGTLLCFPTGTASAAEPENASGTGDIFSENFDSLTPGTYTAAALKELLGWKSVGSTPGAIYEITDEHKLRIYNPFENPNNAGKMNGQFDLYIGEFDGLNTERTVIEFDKVYNEQLTCMTFYSTLRVQKDVNNFIEPTNTMQGFMWNRIRYGNKWVSLVDQTRPENMPYQKFTTNYKTNSEFSINHYVKDNDLSTVQYDDRCIFKSTDHYKVVIDPLNGVDYYINGTLISSSKKDSDWQTNYANACFGNTLVMRVMPGLDVTYDNIRVYHEEKLPEALITELAPGGVVSYWDEYIEIYNNSDKPLNIYDYVLFRDNAMVAVNATFDASVIAKILPGTTTYTSSKNAANTVTHTNPDYEDGWFAPGETVLLWNATNTMYDQAAAKAGNGKTLADFRTAMKLSDDQKAFVCYNEYNFSLNNGGGPYLYALGYADFDYTAKYNNWDHLFGNFVCYVWHVNAAATGFEGETFPQNWNTSQSNTTMKFVYPGNNSARHGVAMDVGAGTTATPGTITDTQKRSFTVTMNGTACTGYLGETYSSLWSGKQLLFAKDADGKMIENPETEILTSDVTAYALEINTLEGASVRTNVPTGIRWQTQINKADYDALKAAIGTDIKEIRFGTLISPTKHVQDAGAFTPEAIKAQNFQDSGYKDVAGTDGEWYKTTEEGYIFAGSLVEIRDENYDLKFSAVGYLTIVLQDDTVITVYGNYNEGMHARSVKEISTSALADPNNGLTPEQLATVRSFITD